MLFRRSAFLLCQQLKQTTRFSREASSLRSNIAPLGTLKSRLVNGYCKPNLAIRESTLLRHFSSEQQPPKSPEKEQENKEEEDDDDECEGNLNEPLLMDFMPRGMPNMWYTLKNMYLVNFVLRAQIDRNFDFKTFIKGARQAFVMVSSSLANNELANLEGVVDKVALKEIKKNYKKLSMAQRRELGMRQSDIVLSFAHNIRIETLKEEFTGTSKYIVYFFIVFDCIPNLEEMLRAKAANRQSGKAIDLFREFNSKKIVCNYEFKREYLENGPCTDWMISKVLHIKERQLVNLLLRR